MLNAIDGRFCKNDIAEGAKMECELHEKYVILCDFSDPGGRYPGQSCLSGEGMDKWLKPFSRR